MGYRDKRLYNRGGRFIWARVRDERGQIIRVSTRCTSEKAASLFADEWERTAADPAYKRSAEATLESAIQDWLLELRRRKVSEATFAIGMQKAGHFVRLWGSSWPLLRVTNDLVLQYIDAREGEGVKPLTVKKELGALKGILEWARFRGTFPRELAEVLPPRYSGQHKPKTRAPSPEEVTALIRQLDPRRGAQVAFIVATGARLGESFRARREDVDMAGLLVRIRGTKTDLAAGVVPLDGLTHAFMAYALENAPGKTVLFAPWGKYHRDLLAACVRAQIDPVTPNDLRRAFGTWHRRAGATAEQVSILLRHTTDTLAQTTYGRITGADLAPALRALAPVPDLYAGASQTTQNESKPMHESPCFAAPPAGIGPATFGLGNQGTSDASSRRSVGGKRAWERKLKTAVESVLYRPRAFSAFVRRLAWRKPLPPHPSPWDSIVGVPRVTTGGAS